MPANESTFLPRLQLCFFLVLSVMLGLPIDHGAIAETPSIHVDDQTHVFRLDAADVFYVFGVNEKGQLQTLYWGRRLSRGDRFPAPQSSPAPSSFDPEINTTPQEYVAWGGGLYVEPDLKITFPDGNRDLALQYVSYRKDGDVLTVQMKDILREVYVQLHYHIDEATGILSRHVEIQNKTSSALNIEQVASATINLPRGEDYKVRYLTGRWAGEWNLQQQHIQPGKLLIESRRGTTSAQNNPWFAIDRGSNDSESGDVWFGALAWSGSWRIIIEQDQVHQVRVTAGLNPFDFGYQLQPGERLESPYLYVGYSHHGIGEASRLLHRFEINSILPHAPVPKVRPVLYNSWEATGFDVNEAGQEKLAEKAASIGIERFVVDDGWFGRRSNDKAGLGDWSVNPVKFPHGLKPLIDKVHSLGMDFGIWVEPEMVNPDSDLYRKHPDWVLNFPGRPRTEARNQLVLNLARPDVRDYVFHFLDQLLIENQIAFLKWDYNRNWSEPGWPAVSKEQEKKVYVTFIDNLYSILKELREKHPNVEIESCSGGGSRVDLGIMHYTDEVWPSDNTDAFDRLAIQDGFTYAYPPAAMMAWVTDSPTWVNQRTLSLEYRFLSSMQGSLGVGANLNHWQPAEFAEAKKMIEQYKSVREIVQRGSLYRLISPQQDSEHSVTETISQDQGSAITFAFLHSSTMLYPFPRIFLRGLSADKLYKIEAIDGKLAADTISVASGSFWMQHGVDVDLRGDFQAAMFRLDAIDR
jgi:alpha-galactosidase